MFFLKGNSGCKILFSGDSNGGTVTKVSKDRDYSARLESQAIKQELFNAAQISNVDVPNVISSANNDGVFQFEMEYIPHADALTFLNIASVENVKIFWQNIVGFIDYCVANSRIQRVDCSTFVDKFETTAEKVAERDEDSTALIKDCAEVFARLEPHYSTYEGICHGDLTFSNMMVSKSGNIHLIDFLDTYFESPLQDIVKLRQDTKHHWTLNIHSNSIDDKRMKILYAHLDELLVAKFSNFEFYKKLYFPTQLLNFLRILPYIENEELYNKIFATCEEILDEC